MILSVSITRVVLFCPAILVLLAAFASPPVAATDGDNGPLVDEFFFLFDRSQSFEDDFQEINVSAPGIYDAVTDSFPGSTIGLGTFADKPSRFHRDVTSQCLQSQCCHEPRMNLSPEATKDDFVAAVHEVVWSGVLSGAKDYRESQLDSLFYASVNQNWGNYNLDVGKKRAIVIATDIYFWQAGHVSELRGLPQPEDPGVGQKIDVDCDGYDYLSAETLAKTLTDRRIIPVFLVTQTARVTLKNGKEVLRDVYTKYESLLNTMKVYGVVEIISSDSSNIIDAVATAMRKLKNWEYTEDEPRQGDSYLIRILPDSGSEEKSGGSEGEAAVSDERDDEGETPVENTSAEDTPAEDTPAEDTPAEDAPAEEKITGVEVLSQKDVAIGAGCAVALIVVVIGVVWVILSEREEKRRSTPQPVDLVEQPTAVADLFEHRRDQQSRVDFA